MVRTWALSNRGSTIRDLRNFASSGHDAFRTLPGASEAKEYPIAWGSG
jgi:hypothetical protein